MTVAGDLYRRARTLLGFSTVSTQTWDAQFSQGYWDRLEGPLEAEHYRAIVRFYERFCAGKSVLDIGCGIATLLRYLESAGGFDPCDYRGTDISPVAIEKCRKRFPTARFEQCDYNRKPFDGRAGVVVFNETLSYFSNPMRTLSKAREENLLPGGHIVVSLCESAEHTKLWAEIAARMECVAAETVGNENGQVWTVKVYAT